MTLHVMKFGGTSMGSVERIEHVAGLIKGARQAGTDIAETTGSSRSRARSAPRWWTCASSTCCCRPASR